MTDRADVVVVGGGSAGCVLASRLSEDPDCRVVLLEAGPDLRAAMPDDVRSGWQPTRSFDWGLRAEPDPFGRVRDLPRGRLLGGCSSTNGTFALRGAPADYDAWSAAGNAGWSFDDVLPFFRRLERDLDFPDADWHGDAGPLPIRRYPDDELSDVAAAALAAYDRAGLPYVEDLNAPTAVGAGRLPTNCRDGVRISTALAYLPGSPEERPNLELRCGAQAAAVELDGTRAVGVRLIDGELVPAGCVVLCAGAYASPGLLQRSGIGDARELGRHGIPVRLDRAGVGANLADHAAVGIELRYRDDPVPGPLFQVGATLHASTAAAGGAPELQSFVFGPYPASDDAPPWFMVAAALLKPRSRGSVSLASAEPADPPRIVLNYLAEPADVDRLVEGLALAEAVAADPAIRALCAAAPEALPTAEAERRDWIRRRPWTYHHVVGTCAMGPAGDPAAVVDAEGRVHGAEGLLVIDASIMPDIPSANTHLPVVMVAERLAESLRASLVA